MKEDEKTIYTVHGLRRLRNGQSQTFGVDLDSLEEAEKQKKGWKAPGVSTWISEKKVSAFDYELFQLSRSKLDENHVFNLGIPDEILQKCGFPKDHGIVLSNSILKRKTEQESLSVKLEDFSGLDKALQNPVAVFEHGQEKKYKEKHEHFPFEDEFDAERWKVITDSQEVRFKKTKEQIEIENNKRTFTVDDCILSAIERTDFLIKLEHYVGEKKVKDEFKIKEVLNKEDLKPVRFIYEGNGFMGESIYESFVCKKNDDSGFKYLMVPHNSEYYKGFDRLVLSEKTFSDIEECQNDLIETLVNQKENHSYKIETNTSQFWNIPQKYKQPLLSYIEKNEKEI